ncbi:MAG: radical SAM family heme chaperone HemW [Lentisphaerae bacterium]|nr:radical SAM family heme chaperone HemW [Lentisphaerota bacterium]
MTDSPISHVYVHVPFCSSKCTYCALYSTVHRDEPARDYVAALKLEIEKSAQSFGFRGPDTIFFGGGTPTQLSDELYAELAEHIRDSVCPAVDAEWTSECAPGTLTAAKLRTMRAVGINRLSFGVQSLDNEVLKSINRRHNAQDVADTFRMAREAGIDRVGLDLIACLPGVSDARWCEDLEQALTLSPEHISVYGLTPEPGTVLVHQAERGEVTLWDEETYFRRLDHTETFLTQRGFERYEISNYAKEGRRCRHNMAYWSGRDYIGFGPGASSRVGLMRWTNTPDVKGYSKALLRGDAVPRTEEHVTPEEDLSERCMFAIRTGDGLHLPHEDGPFSALYANWRDGLAALETNGLVRREDERWHLTHAGRWMADTVAAALLN